MTQLQKKKARLLHHSTQSHLLSSNQSQNPIGLPEASAARNLKTPCQRPALPYLDASHKARASFDCVACYTFDSTIAIQASAASVTESFSHGFACDRFLILFLYPCKRVSPVERKRSIVLHHLSLAINAHT